MNDQLQQALINLIKKLSEGGEFALGKLPSAVEQLVMFTRIDSIMWIVFQIPLLILCVVIFRKCLKYTLKRYEASDDIMFGICGLAVSGVLGLCFVIDISMKISILTSTFFPEAFVIEYLKDMMKPASN